MKLLIVGSDSPIGQDFVSLLEDKGVDYLTTEPLQVDSTDQIDFDGLITEASPAQVINLDSYNNGREGAVFQAEEEPFDCDNANHLQPSLLAKACDRHDIPLLHLSSSYVFDGEKKLGYNEQDELNPKGVFATSQRQGEDAIRKHISKHIILRSSFIFGKWQDETIRQWITDFKTNTGQLPVLRRKFSPTSSRDIARVILAICHQVDCGANLSGVYHYCGLETKKETEFVRQVLKIAAQYDEAVYEVLDRLKLVETNAVPPELANRTLSSKKIFDSMGIKQRSWHGELQDLIRGIYQ